MSEAFLNISTIAFALAVLFFLLAAFLWFYYKIPTVYGDLSGRNAKKSIEKMREETKSRRTPSFRTSDQSSREKVAAMFDAKNIPVDNRVSAKIETQPEIKGLESTESMNADSQETALLSDETALLGDETELLGNSPVRSFNENANFETGLLFDEETALLQNDSNQHLNNSGNNSAIRVNEFNAQSEGTEILIADEEGSGPIDYNPNGIDNRASNAAEEKRKEDELFRPDDPEFRLIKSVLIVNTNESIG